MDIVKIIESLIETLRYISVEEQREKQYRFVLQWDRKTPLRELDLSGRDLSGLDLTEADFIKTNLSKANLSNTNLRGANLSEANLNWANLSGANLSRANLSGANLSERSRDKMLAWQEASRKNLPLYPGQSAFDWSKMLRVERAKLSGANLSEANLHNAKLSGAVCDIHTVWPKGFDFEGAGVKVSKI